jgi:hypothetical protein
MMQALPERGLQPPHLASTIQGSAAVRTRIFAALAAAACCAWSTGCSVDHGVRAGVGHVTVHLTDAPGDFEAVHLVVTGVSVHRAEGDVDSWETLAVQGGTFDLLQLRNGVLATLAIGNVPVGHYDQVRLLLGAGSDVVVDGVTYPLTIPSGLSSGLKLIGSFDVVEGEERELILDFDAARSIHQTGNGKYIMRPTVRLILGGVVTPPADTTGSITGRTLPAGAAAVVHAIQGADTLATASNDGSGAFALGPLVAGSYDVAIDAEAAYQDTTIAGVTVTAGQVTSLGDIQLRTADTVLVGSARAGATSPRR